MDQDTELIPTVVVTGFLGAGKTTLLNRLIDHYAGLYSRPAVMVNEFGTIGVDAALVKEGDFYKIELNKGSIFCICMRTDFITEVKKIAEEIKPDILLIEATGIARVDDMYAMLKADDLDTMISIHRNICVVDAKNFHKIEKTLEASRIQVQYADLLVLNKTDEADDATIEETEDLIRIYNSKAPIVKTRMAELPPEYLDGGEHTVTGKPELEIPSDTLPEDYRSFSFKSSGIFDREKWSHCIREISPGVLRAKGVVHFPEEKLYFEIINGEYSEKEPPEQLALNPKSIFVFISSTAPEISFEDKIKECTIS